MRYFLLSAIALLLALCGSVLAQQRLVLHNDQDDPCSRFKMLILIPDDAVDRQLPVKRFAGGIDSRMVWDPCTEAAPQVAFVFSTSGSDGKDTLIPQQSFSFQREPGESRQKERGEFLLIPPPSAFQPKQRQP
jgi:hypothetical protein